MAEKYYGGGRHDREPGEQDRTQRGRGQGEGYDPRYARYDDEQSGHGRSGYGPAGSARGWDVDDGRVQYGRGQQGWQGPGRSWDSAERGSQRAQDSDTWRGAGYGGYGSEHPSQFHEVHGHHGGGFGSDASYSNQGPGVGYSHWDAQNAHRAEDWQRNQPRRWQGEPYGQYGAQGEYAAPPRPASTPRYFAADNEQRNDRDIRAAMRAAWMGEGYGGPTHHVAPEPARPRRRDVEQRWPKSYTRSDDRIREDLYEHIMRHDHLDASDVTIVVQQGKVTLDGVVPDRYMKHHIEDIADECLGVKEVENRLRVARAKPGVDDHDNRTTGGAMGYSANTDTANPSGTTIKR
jgi:hypothetical protein